MFNTYYIYTTKQNNHCIILFYKCKFNLLYERENECNFYISERVMSCSSFSGWFSQGLQKSCVSISIYGHLCKISFEKLGIGLLIIHWFKEELANLYELDSEFLEVIKLYFAVLVSVT